MIKQSTFQAEFYLRLIFKRLLVKATVAIIGTLFFFMAMIHMSAKNDCHKWLVGLRVINISLTLNVCHEEI